MANKITIVTERNRYDIIDESGILKGARLSIIVRNKKRLILGFGKSAIHFLGEIGNSEKIYRALKDSMNATKAAIESGKVIGYKLIFVDYALIEPFLNQGSISKEEWYFITGRKAENIGNTSDIIEVVAT